MLPTPLPESPRATILVVDNAADNLAYLGQLLTPAYHVVVANSGARALELALACPPDLVLLDVMMPHMDGYEVFRRLGEQDATRDIPVIFVTALDQPADEARGLRAGAVDYLTKPLRPAVVLARVQKQLAAKRSRDGLQQTNDALAAEVTVRRTAEYALAQEASLHAMTHLATVRDPETGNHLLRTQNYVRLLAERLRDHIRFADTLTPAMLALLPKAASLHDIGKIGIPDHILHKPAAFTPEEFTIMQRHSRIGADAIALLERETDPPLPYLPVARQIALWHHEHWDGTGYPDGLAGDEIPAPARLMAIADVFDALTCRRIYKEPIPFELARDKILAGRGSHFDPDIVDAFNDCFDEMCRIAQYYRDADDSLAAPWPPAMARA